MKENESGISEVNVIPRNNNVLVRMTFDASIMALTSGKYEKDSTDEVIATIAGIGPAVRDLSIGDKVLIKLQEYSSVDVEGNFNSVKKLKETYSTLKPSELSELIRKSPRTTVIQYGIFPEFLIQAKLK